MARHTLTAIISRGLAIGMLLATSSAMAATFAVNTTTDTNDSTPGDAICADAGGACSLRAAIEEANSLAGADSVNVPAGNYLLSQGSLAINDAVTVTGAYTKLTVIDGNANGRVFSIASSAGEVTLETMTLQNGSVSTSGGGVSAGNSLLTIRNAVIRDNAATGIDAWGGAIYIWGAGNRLVVENSLITRNSAEHASAIRSSNSDVELRNTTLSYNHSSNARYGVIVDFSNQPNSIALENTTITGNTGGTGLTLFEAQTTIVNSTIAGNSDGAAINAERNSSVTVTNTILYGNNRNCTTNGGTIISGGYNIDDRNTCGFAAAGDQINTDPMLGPLAGNGGPTPTRGLLAGSPALNAGDNTACLATDQRGTARDDGNCDIGAYEGSVAFATCLGATLAVNSTTDTPDASPGDGICADADGSCTLRAAIQEANACAGADIIELPAGTYPLTVAGTNENAAVTGDLDITDELTINGAGAASTVIDASDAAFDDRAFHVLNRMTTSFSGLTIRGVHTTWNADGAGIYTGGDIELRNAEISANQGGHGTGLFIGDSLATADVRNTVMRGHVSSGRGGAIYVAGTLNLSGSVVSENKTLDGSAKGNWGAAIYGNSNTTINITDGSLIDGNSVGYGGEAAVFGFQGVTINIVDSTVSNSLRGTRGVTGWDGSTVNVIRSIISGNVDGGLGTNGIDSTLNITDSTISNNEAHALGSFTARGAGASIGGAFTITGSTISGNRIINDGFGGSGAGAGLYIAGTGSIANSTISGNNNGGQNSRGGGIAGPGGLTMVNSTVYNNYSRYGGGIGIQNGSLSIANSIVAGNSTDCDASYMTVTSKGHNIESQDTCGFTDPTDLVNTDPMLDVLADNGGWTQTHALLSNIEVTSPALDAGDATICAGASVNGVDQRGFTRPWGSGCDIGAYEDMPLYQLSLTVAGTGSGRVISAPGAINCQSGTCTSRIGENTPVLLNALPAADAMFAGWSGDCVAGGFGVAAAAADPAAGNQASVLVDADKVCTATFDPIQHTLSVAVSPLGAGRVEGLTGLYTDAVTTVIDCGTDCEATLPGFDGVIEMIPYGNTGWSFAGWDGCDSQRNNSAWCTMTLDADKMLTANFISADIYVDDSLAPVDNRDMPFGEVLTGTSVEATVTITNNGEGRLSDIWIEDSDYLNAPFSLRENCSDRGLDPGESCSFTVRFAPATPGSFSDSFDIISRDPDEPTLTITVSGVGIVAAEDPGEPLPTAEITFQMKGEGGSGAGGPMELLLMATGLGFALRRRRRVGGMAVLLGASLLALGLAPAVAPAAGPLVPGWYIGASGGWSSSDYSDSDLRSDLVNKGYAITSVSVDDTDTGWKIFGGYQFNRNWAIETSWVDLGDVTSTVGGTIDDAQVPALLSDAASNHGYMGEGATLAGVAIWPVTPQVAPFLKLGAFSWKADVDIKERTTGQSISRNRSGTDMMGGLGLRYTPTPNLEFRAEYEYYDIDPDAAGFFSLGIGYHF